MEILLEPLLRATAGRAAWNTPNVVGPTMLWRHVYLNRLSCQRTSQVPALISTRGHEAYYIFFLNTAISLLIQVLVVLLWA